MPLTFRRTIVVAAICFAPVSRGLAQDVSTIPARLSDSAFWKLVTDVSEPAGYFRSDNLVSNENTFQYVLPELTRTTKPGGVYLGVGPDQNFTYIVGLKPKLAIIFDIRRGNMHTHLMYKALIEESPDRADFLSKLFSRPRPQGLDTSSTAQALFAAYGAVVPDSMLFKKNLAAIKDRLTKHHGFRLDTADLKGIEYVYTNFFFGGPNLSYNFGQGGSGRGRMPSYADLQMEDDGQGQNRAYIGKEANYRLLRDMEVNNLIVPVVGDFAGPKAIRAVGQYLKDRNATVTAFYLSNVEQYLFQSSDDWRRFFENVGTLPLDASSTFIRAVFTGMGGPFRFNPSSSGPRSQTMLASMQDQVKAFTDGRLTLYSDVINTSR